MMRKYNAYSTVAGITLIEVMVAFVILALSVTVLLRIFSSGVSNTILSQQYVDAVMFAESRMAQIGTIEEIFPSMESGAIGKIYTWKTTISPYLPWIENDEETLPVSSFVVDVEVSWIEKGKQRNITLSSIKLQNNSLLDGRG